MTQSIIRTRAALLAAIMCCCCCWLSTANAHETANNEPPALHHDHRQPRRTLRAPVLPPLRNDTVTLSGFDSGAAFAIQLHIAYSTKFRALSAISALPYLCAEATIAGATACMDTPGLIDVPALVLEAEGLLAQGLVDDFSNLASQMINIAASRDDSIVNFGAGLAAASMYRALGATTVNTELHLGGADHAWVTSKYGNSPCAALGSPYISKCPRSYAEMFLNATFNFMGIVPKPPAATFDPSRLFTVDQTKYGANPTANSVGPEGFLFVPPQCQKRRCHLHVHFHGCQQSATTLFDHYAKRTQINEFAMTNDVVVLYPNAAPNVEFFNAQGCWDWYGYEIDLLQPLLYATRDGAQIRIVREMIQGLLDGF